MSVLDLLFPKNCLECRRDGGYICETCLLKVPKGGWSIAQNYSIWEYGGVVRKAIIAIKYKFAFEVARDLGSKASENLRREFKLKKCNSNSHSTSQVS